LTIKSNKNITNLSFLDGIRGLAAFYVLVHHARVLLTQPYYEGFLKHPENYNKLDKLLTYLFASFKFGHEAVLVFFVLSGFVIHLKQANNNSKHFSIVSFYQKRIVRIYPVLLTSITVTFLAATVLYFVTGDEIQGLNFYNFFQNILLLPGLNIFGNNYPMWSLQHEWFFYLVYPLLLVLNKRSQFYSFAIVVALNILYACGIKISIIGEASMTLLYWWIGAVLAELYVRNKLNDNILFAGLATLLLKIFIANPNLSNICFSISIAMIIGYLLKNKTSFFVKSLKRLKFLGDWSFSIYLLHYPIQVLIKETYIFKYGSLPYSFHLVVLGIFISIIISYPIYLITEKKTQAYKMQKLA
jgi:peptidoglycan/LPS O-acetylase OafA/YrhL